MKHLHICTLTQNPASRSHVLHIHQRPAHVVYLGNITLTLLTVPDQGKEQ